MQICFLKRLIVLISGNGTNLQAIIDAVHNGVIANAVISLVVSNRAEAYGLKRAENAGIPAKYFNLKKYLDSGKTRQQYDSDLADIIAAYSPSLIVLAGWMHVLGSVFLDKFNGRVINLHPALPGQFPGTNAIEKAYQAFQKGEITETGVMVHKVIPEIDAGEVVLTLAVPIHKEDSLQQLEERMHETEHKIIVEAVNKVLRETQ